MSPKRYGQNGHSENQKSNIYSETNNNQLTMTDFKFWSRRYNLFQKFDCGILLDKGIQQLNN